MHPVRTLGTQLIVLLALASAAFAGQATPAAVNARVAANPGNANSDDPEAPVPPEVIARGENGRIVVRATRLAEPLRVDGRLDESIYEATAHFGDFIQTLPREGEPSTEKSDVWVFYDADKIYVTCRCWDSAPPDQWVANEMRRDGNQLRDNDTFGVTFDTFHDRRNAFAFYTNPLGALADQTYTDEGNPNRDWNSVWEVRTGRFDGGWIVEMGIPFKSLRYTSGLNQTWGVNFRRGIRRKNEWAHLTALPAALGGSTAWFRVSGSATLVGLDLPTASKNIEIKPYGISRFTTDRTRVTPNDIDGDFGVDAKYGITANLTADVTYNTDFAQVEVDEQQVNLTRFPLSFPEKRDFFLEGRGIFDFGRGANVAGGTNIPGGGGGDNGGNNITPQVFYSRRIGLNQNRVIPIEVGGRVTGKVGNTSIGVLNIQQREEPDVLVGATPATNFTVARVKRDILRRSSIGAIFTNRSESTVSTGSNQSAGVDGSFSFYQNVNLGGYYSRSATEHLHGDDDSYQGRFSWTPDRYGARAEYLKVGSDFNPEVGLVRRRDFKRTFLSGRFSPRPKNIKSVRRFLYEGTFENFENSAGLTETRVSTGHFNVEFESSDQFNFEANKNQEQLTQPFAVVPGVIIPVGDYHFDDAQVSYYFGPQRPASGNITFQFGGFYDGTIRAVTLSGGRVTVRSNWSVEPSFSINHIDLPYGVFTTQLIRARTDYAFSPRMFSSAFLQYNSTDSSFSSNLRYRWEYLPGSELFVVYTDERDTHFAGFPGLKNRAFVVKINKLWRF